MEVIVASLVLGFVVAQFTKYLDAAMEYGKRLDFIRVWAASRSALKQGLVGIVDSAINSDHEDFGTRQDEINQVYWQLALGDKKLVLLLCANCMSFWIFSVCFLICLVALPFVWWQLLVVGVLGFATNVFFLGL